jgi:cyclophilin family peptidyl-prolyl cis-trans isomerase/preprotein translocase subunit SecF
MFGIVKRRAIWLIAAAVLLVASAAAVVVAQARFGFLAPAEAGGSLVVLHMVDQGVDEESLRSFLAGQGLGRAVVQRLGPGDPQAFRIRTAAALPEDVDDWLGPLESELGAVDRDSLSAQAVVTPGPSLASSVLPVLLAALGVTLVVWWAARALSGSLRYPAAALAALVHAVGMAVGLHALTALIVGWADSTSILVGLPVTAALTFQAILTIVGRVRTNVPKYRGDSYNGVLVRSMADSIHTLLVTLVCIAVLEIALLVAAGAAVSALAATVLFGAVGSAYSSLFVFVPLLAGPETRIAGAAPVLVFGGGKGRRREKAGAAPQRRGEGAGAGRWKRWLPIFVAAVVVVALVWILMPMSEMPSDPIERNGMYSEPPPMKINPGKRYIATFETEKGEFVVELYADRAPTTVNNFVFLATEGFYDNTTFHRVIPDFMAQAGDPTATGAGGPGYVIDDEFHPDLKHDQPGVLSMANRGANTGSSQFFITYEATPWLDAYDENGQRRECLSSQVSCHAVFGRVIEGFEVVQSLTPRDPDQYPDYDGDLIYTIRIEER